MSDEAASASNTHEVFVPLRDEGTGVVRPAQAFALGGMRFRLIEPEGYDPEGEQWQFLPGTEVNCSVEVRDGREVLVAQAREE